MLRLDKVVRPWKESAALNDHINLYGFWDETTFLTKSGDVGIVLSISGVDYESLDRSEQEYAVKRLEAALKAFWLRLPRLSIPLQIDQTYHSRRMTTLLWRQRSIDGESSSNGSATIFIRLKSSTASCSKVPGRRPASGRP